MKFKNPDGKKIGALGIMVAGVIAGAMVSDGVVSLLHTPKAAAGTAEAKKETNMLLLKRAAIVAGAGYAGAGIEGTDTNSVLVKAVCVGMATKQGLNIVKDFAATKPSLADTSTPTKKFFAASLGLNCPGTPATQWGMNGSRRRRALRVPAVDFNAPVTNSLDAAVAAGEMLAQS